MLVASTSEKAFFKTELQSFPKFRWGGLSISFSTYQSLTPY
jgi:hypothetical protein